MRIIYREQGGQVLVLVAILITVLLLMAALAVDMGHVYAERRQMQNAADAGALAGARALCLGFSEEGASDQAQLYAAANGASSATVTVNGDRVLVVARTTAETYFAGIIGMNSVDVAAVAEAECGCGQPCSVFPMAFDEPTWKSIPCNAEFYVWDDDRVDEDLCVKCDCTAIVTVTGTFTNTMIGSGHRGWLRLDEPGKAWNAAECGNDCGSSSLRCWILNNFGAPIKADCVPGKTGVDNAAVRAVQNRIASNPDKEVDVVIWDRICDPGETVFGDCPGTLYHILTYGRVELLEVLTLSLYCQEGEDDCLPSDCPKNVKVIRARKICTYSFEACSGLTGSGPPCPGGYRAAALIR